MEPIWKDYYVTLSNNAPAGVDYRIVLDGETIFTGRAFPKPGLTAVSVRINDICADYLERSFPYLLGNADYYDATFSVETRASSAFPWSEVDSVQFCRNWSYEDGVPDYGDGQLPNAPITGILHPAQLLPLFSYDGTFKAHLYGGDFSFDFSEDFSNAQWYLDFISSGVTYLLDLSQYPGTKDIDAGESPNTIHYRVGDYCGGYVLYYINAYGAWDSLVVEGATTKRDNLTRYNRKVVYNNTQSYARGTDNYATEIEKAFVFRTGPLTSDQDSRMHHLLNSTCVYVHDIERGVVEPVVLTSQTHETTNRRGILHFYEIEAVLAQERMRR